MDSNSSKNTWMLTMVVSWGAAIGIREALMRVEGEFGWSISMSAFL